MKKLVMPIILVMLQGCTAYTYNNRPVTLPDEAGSGKFSSVSVVSPKGYDYYNVLFDQYKVFSKVQSGYTDADLEIRVQRSSEQSNAGVTFISLMVSAFTLFVVPAVANFEEKVDFATYYKGSQIDNREYVANKKMILWLFNPPSSQDSGKADRDIDRQFVGRYLTDFYMDDALQQRISGK